MAAVTNNSVRFVGRFISFKTSNMNGVDKKPVPIRHEKLSKALIKRSLANLSCSSFKSFIYKGRTRFACLSVSKENFSVETNS